MGIGSHDPKTASQSGPPQVSFSGHHQWEMACPNYLNPKRIHPMVKKNFTAAPRDELLKELLRTENLDDLGREVQWDENLTPEVLIAILSITKGKWMESKTAGTTIASEMKKEMKNRPPDAVLKRVTIAKIINEIQVLINIGLVELTVLNGTQYLRLKGVSAMTVYMMYGWGRSVEGHAYNEALELFPIHLHSKEILEMIPENIGEVLCEYHFLKAKEEEEREDEMRRWEDIDKEK